MTKQIEDYPELDKWLEENEEELSEGTFGFDLTCVKQKLLEMQSKIDELTEEAENSDWLAKKAVELTEQNKELREQKEQAGATFVKVIEYAVDTEGGMDWLREWLNAATYEELVKWGWEDTPEDVFEGLIQLNKESK